MVNDIKMLLFSSCLDKYLFGKKKKNHVMNEACTQENNLNHSIDRDQNEWPCSITISPII